jgi:5'-nucleotidase
MRIKSILAVFCLLIAVDTSLAQSPPSTKTGPNGTQTTLTILQLNDVYQISPVDKGKRGGMARVATMQKQIRATSPNTLFLLAGDFVSPSVASRLFKGKQMIDALNAAGLDVATLGNHEFDFGADTLRERMKESRFAYTVANVIDKATGKPFGTASPYLIRNLGGVRVAIIGLLLAETATMSNPGPGVRFDDAVTVGARLSRRLRRQGAEIIIALTHLPMRDDKRLAATGDLDLIIGGHEHEFLQALVGHTLILKQGSDARNLGRIDLRLARAGRAARGKFRIQAYDFAPLPVTDAVKDDPDTAAVVAGYDKQLNDSLGEVIGRTSVMLDARSATVRFKESNLGNFLADAYRQALDTDVALVNGGGIRSDATYGPGDITKRDVLTILPFENTLAKVRLTGAHIKRLLENGVSRAGQEDGRFPQVSGMTFTYDAGKPAGSRVTGIEVNGQPIQSDKSYTMTLNAYLLGGGDGYDLKGAEVLIDPEGGPVEPDVVMEGIRKAGTIAPQVEGRIKPAQPVGRAWRMPLPRANPVSISVSSYVSR